MSEILNNGRPERARNGKPKGYELRAQRDDPTQFESLLSDEEKEALRVKAREQFLEERKDQARKALYARFLDEERREHDPKHALVPIFLQLPGSAAYIMLDGKQYFTNTVYNEVPVPVANVLIEQMNRAWAHEEETEVRTARGRRHWRPPPGIGFANFMDNRIPRNLSLSTEQLTGAVSDMQRMMHG